MTNNQSVVERMECYLESSIACKERELVQHEAELSALRSNLATLRNFVQQVTAGN